MKRILVLILISICLMTLNSWADGIWYWNPATSTWIKAWSDVPSGPIAVGDVTGDGKADIVSCWANGLWYQDGITLGWTKVYSVAPSKLAIGDINGDGRAEIVGTWEIPKYILTTSASPSVGGTVTPNSGTYDSGTVVPLTATANQGYTFTSWTGNISGLDNPITVTINSNKNIIANFSCVNCECTAITWNRQWNIYPGVKNEVCYVGTVPEGKTYLSWDLYGISPEVICSVIWEYPGGTKTGEIRGDIVNTGIKFYDPVLPGDYTCKITCSQEGSILSRAILNPM